jgi:hypothetical protein
MYDEAVKWYKKRVSMGKWIEEVYCSAMNIARITNNKEWAWRAHEFSPRRIESLVSYGAYCRITNSWSHEVLSMLLYASGIPKPSVDCLFVENDIYDWKIFDELSIVAYYLGKKDISKKFCMKLLTEGKLPASETARVEANLKFSIS